MEPHPESNGRAAELANSLTHGIGAALGVAALVLMVVFASLRGTARHIVGAAIFGSALVLLYTMSTLYHAFRGPRVKRVFKILDHNAIFVLIAGTYTPFCLASLRGGWGWSIFGVIWGLAVLGITFKSIFISRLGWLSTAVYLGMGWLVIIAARPLAASLSPGGLAWLLGGGVFYSAGVAFYAWKSLKYHHAVWHLFVLGGSLCHVVAVLFFVIPRPA
ncbi:PAQR family membrane homeostasis protein TrhA [Mesoterricola sediminis]|uniref:Hemolysin III n=1 Tax=Mesoterricola sediminis TaxID=2927980 RepID=A0AA48H0E9_9BACT|nr:hemolysin III family protein [Mesoterricola sediminis]BDU77730.1 hemolysin III [Mesoterricola sediminis]